MTDSLNNFRRTTLDIRTAPDDCGTPACALGWIGFFAGISGENHRAALPLLGFSLDSDGAIGFYTRCDRIHGADDYAWTRSATLCASVLRLYADKYHPADDGIAEVMPASVRAIFQMTPGAIAEAIA